MRRRNVKSDSGSGKPASADDKQEQLQTCGSCCRMVLIGTLVIVGVLSVILYCLPSPIDPIAFRYFDEEPPQFTGVYAVNNELQKAKRLFEGEIAGPEAFAVDKDGFVYSGLSDGSVIKIDLKAENFTVVARMGEPPHDKCVNAVSDPHCGRVLGLQFDSDGSLLVIDSFKGLVRVDLDTGGKEVLYTINSSTSCRTLNSVTVLSNGSILMTCQSTKYTAENFWLDFMEGKDNGMLLHYNPGTKLTTIVREHFYLANGIAKSSNEDFLIVSEFNKARILRYYLKGPKAGHWDVFVDNLPGLVDNITPSRQTPGFWAALVIVVYPGSVFDRLAQLPWVCLFLAKLHKLDLVFGLISPHAMVLKIDEEGRVLRSLHDETGEVVSSVSEATEIDDELILGSFFAPFMAKLKL